MDVNWEEFDVSASTESDDIVITFKTNEDGENFRRSFALSMRNASTLRRMLKRAIKLAKES